MLFCQNPSTTDATIIPTCYDCQFVRFYKIRGNLCAVCFLTGRPIATSAQFACVLFDAKIKEFANDE